MMKTILELFLLVILYPTFIFGQIQGSDQLSSPSESIKLVDNFNSNNTSVYHDSTSLDSFILAKMNQYHFPGVSACIVKDDQIIWKGAYGYANIELNKLVTDSTLFYLASASKPVTATALMQLWEEELFGLDDDINNFLPFQVRNPSHPDIPITLRMLLTHTSSINDNFGIINPLRTGGVDSPIALDSFLVNYLVPGGSYYHSSNYNSWAPGSQWEYSNIGAALIGNLVETISNTSFEQYCQDSIFIPLGMNESSWFLANLDMNNIAMPYDYNYNALNHPGQPQYPSAQLRTSAIQLSRFLSAYIQMGQIEGIKILDSTTVDLMTTVQYPSIDPIQGLIWNMQDIDIPYVGTRFACGHLGGAYLNSASAFIAYILETGENIGAIILANHRSDDGIMEIGLEFLAYGIMIDKIYPLNTNLNLNFMQPDIDTLRITTNFFNSQSHIFNAYAIIQSMDNTYIDSIRIYDDGQHGDNQAEDGTWGNYIGPISIENEFILMVSTTDLNTGDYFRSTELTRFTTIGPVIWNEDDYELQKYSDSLYTIKVSLRNESSVHTISDVTARLSSSDSNVTEIFSTTNPQSFADIEPEQSVQCNGSYGFYAKNNPQLIDFKLEIYSGGHHFWTQNLQVVTAIPYDEPVLPTKFTLHQNYPNPFNPTTKINYQLPITNYVELSIYNLLGQKVATLLSEKQNAGYHQVEWDASRFSSGMYYYRIEAGDFQDVKKMILLR